jgi:hypothetical protein
MCRKATIKRSKFAPKSSPPGTPPGWYCYSKIGGCGEEFAADNHLIVGQETGRIINPDIADQVNTLQKMAQKRALIAATLIGVNASEYFTQDLDDLPLYDGPDVVDVTPRIVQAQPPAKAPTTRPTAPEPPPADTVEAEWAAIPNATTERAQATGTPPAAARKLAEIRCPEYALKAPKFAKDFAAYQDKAGNPDHAHIRARILLLGFPDITTENVDLVFQKLSEYALSKEADAAQAAA